MIEWIREHRYKYKKDDPFNIVHYFFNIFIYIDIFIVLNFPISELFKKTIYLEIVIIASSILLMYSVKCYREKIDMYIVVSIFILGLFYGISCIMLLFIPSEEIRILTLKGLACQIYLGGFFKILSF